MHFLLFLRFSPLHTMRYTHVPLCCFASQYSTACIYPIVLVHTRVSSFRFTLPQSVMNMLTHIPLFIWSLNSWSDMCSSGWDRGHKPLHSLSVGWLLSGGRAPIHTSTSKLPFSPDPQNQFVLSDTVLWFMLNFSDFWWVWASLHMLSLNCPFMSFAHSFLFGFPWYYMLIFGKVNLSFLLIFWWHNYLWTSLFL